MQLFSFRRKTNTHKPNASSVRRKNCFPRPQPLAPILIICLLLTLLTACTDQPPDPTPRPTRTLAPPSTVLAGTPGPTSDVPDERLFQPPTVVAAPTVGSERTPAPFPRTTGALADLEGLPLLTSDPAQVKQIGAIAGQNRTADGKPEPMRAMALSPDKKLLAVADRAEIWIIELATSRTVQRLAARAPTAEERGANSLSWSNDGRFLAAGGMRGVITLWRWDSAQNKFNPGGTPLASSPVAEVSGDTVEVAFSPDSKTLAGFGSDGSIALYSTLTGQVLQIFTSEFAGYFSWSPDSAYLVDELLLLHNRENGQTYPPMDTVAVGSDAPQGVALAADGRFIALSGDAFELWLFETPLSPTESVAKDVKRVSLRNLNNTNSPTAPRTMPRLKEGRPVVWSPSSKWVAVGNVAQAGQISVYTNAGDLILTFGAGGANPGAIQHLLWSHDSVIMSAGNDGELRIWQLSPAPQPTPTPGN
jgi:WD40 repeat protein